MQGHRVASVLAVLGASLVLAACGGGSSEGEIMDKAETAAKGGGGGGGGTKSATLVADAGVASLMLAWNDTGAQQYNVYLSSSPGCDIKQYTLCPDGKMLANVRSPLKAGALVNGRVYYAQVESVTNRSASLSNEAAARPTTLEFNDTVWSIAAAADGTKYLGGDFTRVGLTSGQGVALDVLSGRPSIAGFPIIGDGGVTSAAPDGAGGWFIGGDYRRVGQANKPYLMRVRADGSVDTAWNPVPNSAVNAIAVMNGVVYIAGNFTAINGQQRLSLAALDAATGQLLPWNPVPNNGVWTIAAVHGTIYVGGTFTMIGGFYRNQVAAIDAFGNILPWDPNTNGTVATLTASGSTIYMGGFFTTVSGQARNKLAALDAVTGKPTAWNASLVCGGCEVRALAVSGTTLYVGGRFPQIGTVARNGLAAVDTRNAAILPWNPNPDAPVWSLGVTNDSRGTTVYAGGEFTAIGGQKRSYLAAVDAQGAALAWAPEPIGKVEVVRIAGSHLFAGGRFTGLGAIVRNGLAAIDATGALKSWNPNAYGGARALAVTGNTIYAGGVFTTVGGQAHQHLVKIDSTGAVDPWAPSFNWPVRALAVGASGNLYVGGEFSAVNGTPRSRIAAFSSSGQLLGWAPNPDHYVYAMAVAQDAAFGETLYVGGQFSSINGVNRRRLAQLTTTGIGGLTGWDPWGYEIANQGEAVHALATTNGTIYAGGGFTRLGHNLSQISANGNITPLYANGPVHALALSGSTLYAGGEFTQVYNGTTWVARNRAAALDTASRAVTSFNPNIGDREVYSVAVDGASAYLGGSFTQVGGDVVSGFATVSK